MKPDFDLSSISPVAWIMANEMVNENQQPIEFTSHRFLIEPFEDMHHNIVVRKSAQIGFSVLSILKSVWLAEYKGMNTIYVLPTQDIVKSFVQPKVDPLLTSNEAIKKIVSKDSVTLKQIGNRFIHYKGSGSQREAISTSADILAIDEYDRCLDMSVLNTYDSRLQASQYGWRWRFSNPSAVGFGVDGMFTASDQRHWFVKHKCGHNWFMDFDKDGESHYVDQERKIYACGKCDGEITNEERQNGEWVAAFPGRSSHGYWFSQMMAPWVSAERILEQKEDSSIEFFYNFVLGKAYTPADMIIDRSVILRACSPGMIAKQNVCMGVDNGIVKHWVMGTPDGIFAYGQTESWDEIEHLRNSYDAFTVIDANPYPATPKKLVDKYPGKVFINYFVKDTKNLGIVRWGAATNRGVVYSDRTKIIDLVAQEISDQSIMFRQTPYELEDYIAHWSVMYRTTRETNNGPVGEWVTKENKADHWAFATLYFRTALAKVIGSGGGHGSFVTVGGEKKNNGDYVDDDGQLVTDLSDKINEAYDNTAITDWRDM